MNEALQPMHMIKTVIIFTRLLNLGCVRLGNPDFDFGFRISDFPIKREIQKRISTNRNPFPRRISIKGP